MAWQTLEGLCEERSEMLLKRSFSQSLKRKKGEIFRLFLEVIVTMNVISRTSW